jgi:hypothetical protein
MAHRYTQRAQALTLIMSLVLAVQGIVARLAYPSALPAVTIAGAVWAALYAIVPSPLAGRYLRTSLTSVSTTARSSVHCGACMAACHRAT